jgi:hypothetical protein
VKTCRECSTEFTPYRPQAQLCGEPCRKASARKRFLEWKKRNPGADSAATKRWKDKHPGYVHKARADLIAEVTVLKSAPCTDCGNCFPPECMDFDHVGDDKLGNVGTMTTNGNSRASVMAEIAKCELVCANCHRTRTKNRSHQRVKS